MVREMIAQSVDDAIASYLDGGHARRCIAEWARQNLQISVDESQVRAESMEDFDRLADQLRAQARDEARQQVAMTLGEYIDDEAPPKEWDLRGLSSWAMQRFSVQLSQNQLRKMDPGQIEEELVERAGEQIDRIDLTPISSYLEDGFSLRALAEWARGKWDIDLAVDELGDGPDSAREALLARVEAVYEQRETEYPVEHALDMTVGQSGTENVYAVEALVAWANRKYDAGLETEEFLNAEPRQLYDRLIGLAREWADDQRLRSAIRKRLGDRPDPDAAIELAQTRFDTALTREDLDGDVEGTLVRVGRRFLRREMTELERFVLLQIHDSSWKDHLLNMDHLRDSIGLRSFAEQDPRVAYKREGMEQFSQMMAGVVDKVTDMILRVRLSGAPELSSVYQVSNMVHEQLQGYDHLAQDMADQAQAAEPQKVKQIVREAPKVGRNDPCPCGSGRKYKKCCGREG
jgi:preprotein translocase subunit SecA